MLPRVRNDEYCPSLRVSPPSLRTGYLSLRAERSNPARGVPCLDCFTLRVRNDGPAPP
ncbi:MAG: hypothetical protein LBT00_09080 [Spirochaetaceae bacterium]|nr:hypothetical protein [Spirochaetaceae bacterium]